MPVINIFRIYKLVFIDIEKHRIIACIKYINPDKRKNIHLPLLISSFILLYLIFPLITAPFLLKDSSAFLVQIVIIINGIIVKYLTAVANMFNNNG